MFTHKEKWVQLLRFCAVGLGNTAVDFTTFFLLTRGGVTYLLAQVLSYTAGVINSFLFNRKWTFQMNGKVNVPEIMKFIMVNGLSLLVSSGFIFLLYDVCHQNLWVSKVLAGGGGFIVNFMGSRFWVFTADQETRSEFS